MAHPPTNPKSKRRWMQFSLRTEFIVVTGVCVALSMWVVPLERKRRAVAAIEALHGSVTYQPPTTGEPFPTTFLRRWFPPVYFDEITEVNLNYSQITDAGLAHLRGLTSLHELSLEDTQVTDAGLAHLQGLTSLRCLHLGGTKITDAGLTHLQGLANLEKLTLLFRTQVTHEGVAQLRKILPKCEIWPGWSVGPIGPSL